MKLVLYRAGGKPDRLPYSQRNHWQCCEKPPALHYREPGNTFHQGTPTFQEDLVIPWEGPRLVKTVKDTLPKLKSGEPVKLAARVSEGPEVRQELKKQIEDMLPKPS